MRNYGKKDPKELFDVYCFAKELEGTNTHTHARSHAHRETEVLSVFAHIFASYCFAALKEYTPSLFSKETIFDLKNN